jgi:CheY-like chemotaxis protein
VRVGPAAGAPADRIMSVLLVPIPGADGRAPDAITVVAVDCTREAELVRQAEEASRLKDEFLLTLSHELRTPLTAIVMWAAMLRRSALDEARRARAIEVIERNARQQTRLIEDLLDVSRIATRQMRLLPQPIDLAGVLRAAVEAVRPAAEARSIRLDCHLDPRGGPVQGDAGRLQQVALNLLSNALKFTPNGGSVTVRLEREGPSAVVRVSDTGEGLDPAFVPHVFDRFRQADSSIRRRHGGLGIGLAIAKELVELHGGTISAASDGPGRGATFTIHLPLRSGSAAEPSARRDGHATRDGLRVLVVEDDLDSREAVSATFADAGVDVRAAATAGEALAVLDSWLPDVLVSDIGLPDEDGYALLRRIRARPADAGAWIPAVALTAYATGDDARRALSAGYQMHLAKPVDPARLVRVVEDLSGWSRAL